VPSWWAGELVWCSDHGRAAHCHCGREAVCVCKIVCAQVVVRSIVGVCVVCGSLIWYVGVGIIVEVWLCVLGYMVCDILSVQGEVNCVWQLLEIGALLVLLCAGCWQVLGCLCSCFGFGL